MSAAPTPAAPKTNRIGLPKAAYEGGKSTLCLGCGHDVITKQVITAFYEMGVAPHQVAKFSGIGCSSKTPAYFLNRAWGFNGVHGRMPSLATGALMANPRLVGIGVSGDGDTASIGVGQFVHLVRRNVPLLYIIENNGVYGLTKGQFSATADVGAKLKTGMVNELTPVDCCIAAIELGASFVARSFSGDKRQLSVILKASLAHKGLSVIDVVSPCTTFNDHDGSTKSYAYMKDHEEPLHELGFVPSYEDIEVDFAEGSTQEVELHDGSRIFLKKLGRDYDPTDRLRAIGMLHAAAQTSEVLTGILYVDRSRPAFTELLNLVPEPLATLPQERTRPSAEDLAQIIDEFR